MQLDDARAQTRALALDNDSVIAASIVDDLLVDAFIWMTIHRTQRTRVPTADTLDAGGWGVVFEDTSHLAILDVLAVNSSSSAHGAPLQYLLPQQLLGMRKRSTTTGTPKYWSFHRLAGNSNKVRVMFHPPTTDAFNFTALCLVIPQVPDSDNEAFDVDQHEAYAIRRIAALDLAHILQRTPALRASIAQALSMELQLQLGILDHAFAHREPLESPA